MRAVGLRCEHRHDTPCVDDPAPRLSWSLESTEPGQRQTAYRICVAADDQELWDSGRIASANTIDVAYAGKPLPDAAELTWAVQVWDKDEQASELSEPARFRTGPSEWSAVWIGRDPLYDPGMPVPGTEEDLDESDYMMIRLSPCPVLRRSFAVASPIRRATVYATARGVLDLELNGARIGDAVLAPGWTDYRERIEYTAHDVTDLVRTGENVIGATIGDGWYAGFVGMDS